MGFHLKEIFTGLLPVRHVPGKNVQDAELVAAFEAHKKAGSKALLVFTDLTGAKTTYMGPPADCAALDAHILHGIWSRTHSGCIG